MGGFGSGNWYRWDKKDTTEDCRHIDINRWFREKLLRPGYSFNWYWKNVQENEKASITVKAIQDAVELSYTITIPNSEPVSIKYKIPLSWTPCNYGGVRPWFKCPGIINGHHCWKRAAKLYLKGRYFLCRNCHDLAYTSQREDWANRLLLKAQKIRRRLGGHPGIDHPFPKRPRGMHRETYSRLRCEANELEHASLMATTERFRLFEGQLGRSARKKNGG